MARGLERHNERKRVVASFGKTLVRRAESRCEICRGSEGKISTYEVPPLLDEPAVERCILLCGRCLDAGMGAQMDADAFHFLESSVWSEVNALQVFSVRLLRRLSESRVDWATEVLETLYLPPESEEWLASDR